MRWDESKRVRPRSRNTDADEAIWSPGVYTTDPGLHTDCEGCSHIHKRKCRFVKNPKQIRRPCYFREHV